MSEMTDPIFALITEHEEIYEIIAGRSNFKNFLALRKGCTGVVQWDYPDILEDKKISFIAVRFTISFISKPANSWSEERRDKITVLVADTTYEKVVPRAIEWADKIRKEKEHEFHESRKTH